MGPKLVKLTSALAHMHASDLFWQISTLGILIALNGELLDNNRIDPGSDEAGARGYNPHTGP